MVRHGLTAVAIGQVVAAALATVVALVLAVRHLEGFGLRAVLWSLRPTLAGSVVMVVVVVVLRRLLGLDEVSLLSLVALGSLALVAYAVPVYVLDRANLRSAVQLVRGTPS